MAKFTRRRNGRRRAKLKRRKSFRSKRSFGRRVRREVNRMADKKFLDEYVTGTAFSNASDVVQIIPTIVTGTGDSARIGSEITVRSLKMFFRVYGNPANTISNSTVRIIVGCWKDFQLTSPNVARILTNITVATTSPLLRTYLQSKSWIPMYDRTFLINNSLDGVAGKLIKCNFSGKRLPMKRTQYNGSNVPDHCYFYLIINEQSAGNYPGYTLATRMTWVDV